jgi:hypothetical protein
MPKKRAIKKKKFRKRTFTIGEVGYVNTDQNPHWEYGVKKGTMFEIVSVCDLSDPAVYPYEVKFQGEEFQILNDRGPLLSCNQIGQTNAMKALYGKV